MADSIRNGIGGACFILGMAIFFLLLGSSIGDGEFSEEIIKGMRKWGKRCAISFPIIGLLGLAMPNSKTVALMIILPKIAESKAIQTDLPEIYDDAVAALKSYLKPKEEKKP